MTSSITIGGTLHNSETVQIELSTFQTVNPAKQTLSRQFHLSTVQVESFMQVHESRHCSFTLRYVPATLWHGSVITADLFPLDHHHGSAVMH
jgi:hypothetical protein